MRTLALLALLAGCTAQSVPGVWRAQPFITTFWCAPPLAALDDARLEQIATAGFTTIGAPCEGELTVASNRRALAGAARHNLRVWVADHRLYAAAAGDPNATAQIADVVADFRDAPALDGYVVADEPPTPAFAPVAATVIALRTADPARLAYVNLLPNYIPPALLGAASYDDYLHRSVADLQPQLLSVDYYPFGTKKDRSTFFDNLDAVRDASLRYDLPFLWIVLAMPHGPYRDPSEAELAWQVFHALAYGARGVSYFTYWTPHDPTGRWQQHNGIIENGQPTEHYAQVTRVNQVARAIGNALDGWRSIAVADSTGEIGAPFPIGPIEAIDGGRFSVGLFANATGGLAALLVNRDYGEPAVAALRLRDGAAPPEAFDAGDAHWRRDGGIAFPLAPGAAQLLRWPG